MAENSAERKASTLLLSLITAKAVGSFGGSEKKNDEEQRTQSMMYAARMRYLDDKDQMTPDPLFMTRKQAQKVAQRHDTSQVTVSLRKLDVGGPQASRKANATTAAATAAGLNAAWKKANNNNNSNNHRMSVDERHQVWEAKFQAGCRFWQNVETAECRASPPPNAQHIGGFPLECLDDDDDENLPFPASFAFLETGK